MNYTLRVGEIKKQVKSIIEQWVFNRMSIMNDRALAKAFERIERKENKKDGKKDSV